MGGWGAGADPIGSMLANLIGEWEGQPPKPAIF